MIICENGKSIFAPKKKIKKISKQKKIKKVINDKKSKKL